MNSDSLKNIVDNYEAGNYQEAVDAYLSLPVNLREAFIEFCEVEGLESVLITILEHLTDEPYYATPLNLVQTLIHTGRSDSATTVVGYYDNHNDELVLRALYGRGEQVSTKSVVEWAEDNIVGFTPGASTVTIGEGFNVRCYSKDRK